MNSLQPLICVPVLSDSFETLLAQWKQASAEGDMVELRLDGLTAGGRQSFLNGFRERAFAGGRPLILTLRSPEQGGAGDITEGERIQFWQELVNLLPGSESTARQYVDIEDYVLADSGHGSLWKQIGLNRIICSYHDFSGKTPDPVAAYHRLKVVHPGPLKIAVSVTDSFESFRFFQALKIAREEGRNLMAVAMGEAGLVTRILGPAHGSLLTFASLNQLHGTAPGQITADQLRRTYNISRLNAQSSFSGLIGNPTTQSLSPVMHNAAFSETGVNAVYVPFKVDDLESFVSTAIRNSESSSIPKPLGFSVTIPHKISVMPLLDRIDPVAQAVGAVNTIALEDGKLIGMNTDVEGYLNPLFERFGSLAGMRIAVLGGGGAARSAVFASKREGASVEVFVRDPQKGIQLSRQLGVDLGSLHNASFKGFDIVVNATPLGTLGMLESNSPASAVQLEGAGLAYDLVYNPVRTRFIDNAAEAGCAILPGIEMLISQAVRQFEVWTHRSAPADVMRQAAMSALGGNQ